MLLVAVTLLAGAVAGWCTGRRLPATPARWRAPGLLVLGAVLLPAGPRLFGGTAGLAVTSAGYVLLIAFASANRRRAGWVLVAAGLAANLAVIASDHGMPVRGLPAGLPAGAGHHGLSTRDHLPQLADQLRLPVLGETVSPGDICLSLGAAVVVFAWLEPGRRPRPPMPARPANAAEAS